MDFQAPVIILSAAPYQSPGPDTSTWYQTQYGCLRTDPTLIARLHSFPDASLPRAQPTDPAAWSKVCLSYRTAWPATVVNAAPAVETEREHPQFAFNGGGPGTVAQIDLESELRRLDQPLTKCQPAFAMSAPLFSGAGVFPPTPTGVPTGPQNAANPVAAILRPNAASTCRAEADRVATGASSRLFNNPTRQDTARFVKPFSPPGIGTAGPSTSGQPGQAYYS